MSQSNLCNTSIVDQKSIQKTLVIINLSSGSPSTSIFLISRSSNIELHAFRHRSSVDLSLKRRKFHKAERSGYAIPLAKGTLKGEREKGLVEPHWWNSFDWLYSNQGSGFWFDCVKMRYLWVI
ncbi:unnamed protein product [Lactuca virosa]|uniref:Uncharacterized protein n=1 Tax=Lactuca virosa TaxID=75947 RepID=A0AAU9N5N1_9ASTR|nr:unnamed protein product [Lactuca virosa]